MDKINNIYKNMVMIPIIFISVILFTSFIRLLCLLIDIPFDFTFTIRFVLSITIVFVVISYIFKSKMVNDG